MQPASMNDLRETQFGIILSYFQYCQQNYSHDKIRPKNDFLINSQI